MTLLRCDLIYLIRYAVFLSFLQPTLSIISSSLPHVRAGIVALTRAVRSCRVIVCVLSAAVRRINICYLLYRLFFAFVNGEFDFFVTIFNCRLFFLFFRSRCGFPAVWIANVSAGICPEAKYACNHTKCSGGSTHIRTSF